MRTFLPHPGLAIGLILGNIAANLMVTGQIDVLRAAAVTIVTCIILVLVKVISHGVKHRSD